MGSWIPGREELGPRIAEGLLSCGLLSFQRRGNEAWQRARRSRLVWRGFRYWVWSRLKLVPRFGFVSSSTDLKYPACDRQAAATTANQMPSANGAQNLQRRKA